MACQAAQTSLQSLYSRHAFSGWRASTVNEVDLFCYPDAMAWTRKLTPPIILKDGRLLEILSDVRETMLTLPERHLFAGLQRHCGVASHSLGLGVGASYKSGFFCVSARRNTDAIRGAKPPSPLENRPAIVSRVVLFGSALFVSGAPVLLAVRGHFGLTLL
jgi:hypothetical protein